MYKLFYADGSAALGVRVLLEEIGAQYELLATTIDMKEARPAEQLAINPNGWVPVLLWQGGAMYECAASTILLGDRHAGVGLAPTVNDPARALYLQTLVYFSNTVQTAFQQNNYPERFADTPEGELGALRRGVSRLRAVWGVVDDQIGEKAWVLGDQFSAADIYLHMLTTWLNPKKGQPDLSEFPNAARIAAQVAARPSVRRVYFEG